MTQARHCLIMKKIPVFDTVSQIKGTARSHLLKCWAELGFFSVLNCAVLCGAYSLIIILGILTGSHNGDTILPVFTSLSPAFIISAAAVIAAVYIITSPLYFGIKWYVWQITAGAYMPVSSIFASYTSRESIFHFIKLRLTIDLRKLPAIIAAIVISVESIYISEFLKSVTEAAAVKFLITVGAAVIIGGVLLLLFIHCSRYLPTAYIIAEDLELDTAAVLKKSSAVIKERHTLLLTLYASFYMWYALSILIYPLMFAIPYISLSTAVLMRQLLTEQENQTDENNIGKEEALV